MIIDGTCFKPPGLFLELNFHFGGEVNERFKFYVCHISNV